MPDYFSQRQRLAGPPPGTLLRDDVPVSFRIFLLNLPGNPKVNVSTQELHAAICDCLQVWPNTNLSFYDDCKYHVQKCRWFRIYDIIERLYQIVHEKHPYCSTQFANAINVAFVEQNIGWRLVDGEIITRGSEAFENTLNAASRVLMENAKPTAAQRIHNAIKALSARPNPDTSGAASHATSAVECVLHQITGKAMSLGKFMDSYKTSFHPALKRTLDGIYGFASDAGARHGREGKEPTFAEAQFVIAICAAACTLLTTTNPQIG